MKNHCRLVPALDPLLGGGRDAQGCVQRDHPDHVEHDIRKRLAALTNSGTILVENMTPAFELQDNVIDPVAEKIEHARNSQSADALTDAADRDRRR